MTAFTGSDDLDGATFTNVSMRGAQFRGVDLADVVMRGVDASGLEIDGPWLFEGKGLTINGIDVLPFVNAELDKRFPGRAQRSATDPDGLRSAWAALEGAWAATLERVETMPVGTVDISVGGEWSFAQTLRHLVLATDMWLGKAVLEREQPFHPLGLIDSGTEGDGFDTSGFVSATPPYAEVLAARAERVAMVRDYLADVTAADLATARKNPHAPECPESTLSCLHTILAEEWEHHRYAVRDLDALDAQPTEK